MTLESSNLTKTNAFRIVIVIDDGFPIMSLTLITEPLRVANRESSKPIFVTRVISPNGQAVRSSSGLQVEVDGGLDHARADAIIVLASYFPDRMATRDLINWLAKRNDGRTLLGCVDTGALIFAQSGLLKNRPAAVHHEAIVGFSESFGSDLFTDQLFDVTADRCSSAGGVATIDMTLEIIERLVSSKLAWRVAEVLNYRRLETSRARGEFGRDWSLPRLDRDLAKAVEIMMANLEDPVPVTAICARVGMPNWRLRRLFRKHLNMSVQGYYLELRLDRARNLLRNSSEPVGNIALMCGFPASESFSRAYKARYGISPSRDRVLQ